MMSKEDMLAMCDLEVEKLCGHKNEIAENIKFLLKERGFSKRLFLDEEVTDELDFEFSFNHICACKRYGNLNRPHRSETELNICIDKLYEIGGCELLEEFLMYIIKTAIPEFKAGIVHISNFDFTK